MDLDRRLELQTLLETILGTDNVYFQPPATIQMQYPAIVYKRDNDSTKKANNDLYSRTIRYMVTVIDRDPDSDIPRKIVELPYASFQRNFAKDNLNHDIFNLYY